MTRSKVSSVSKMSSCRKHNFSRDRVFARAIASCETSNPMPAALRVTETSFSTTPVPQPTSAIVLTDVLFLARILSTCDAFHGHPPHAMWDLLPDSDHPDRDPYACLSSPTLKKLLRWTGPIGRWTPAAGREPGRLKREPRCVFHVPPDQRAKYYVSIDFIPSGSTPF